MTTPVMEALYEQGRVAHREGDERMARVIAQKIRGLQGSYAEIERGNKALNPAKDFGASDLENAAAGAGKFLNDSWLGLKQRTAFGADKVNNLQNEAEETRKRDAALMDTKSGKAGYFASGMVNTAPMMLIPGAGSVAGGAAIGAGMGALQPTTAEDGDLAAFKNAALGGAFGAGGAWAGNKLGGVRHGVDNAARNEVYKAGKKLGLDTTPGARSDSGLLQHIETIMRRRPFTGQPFKTMDAKNREVLNKLAADAIGQPGEAGVTTATLDAARDSVGSAYEKLAAQGLKKVNPSAIRQTLKSIADDTDDLLQKNSSVLDEPLVNKFLAMTDSGQVDTTKLVPMASKFGKRAYKEMTTQTGDRDLGQAFYQIKDKVDELLKDGLSIDDKKSFDAARQNYRRMMQLLDSRAVDGTSDVNGQLLANFLKRKDRPGYVFGADKTPLYEAARFTDAFKSKIPTSGTAEGMAPGVVELATSPIQWLLANGYLSSPSRAALAGIQKGVGTASPTASRAATMAEILARYPEMQDATR